jgi:hypothetical protein
MDPAYRVGGGGSARGVEILFGTYLKSPSNKPKQQSQRSWEVQMYGKHPIYVFTVRNCAKSPQNPPTTSVPPLLHSAVQVVSSSTNRLVLDVSDLYGYGGEASLHVETQKM